MDATASVEINEHGCERVERTYNGPANERFYQLPPPYGLSGQEPDVRCVDPARVVKICASRGMPVIAWPGLVLEASTATDRWYITFNEPDSEHTSQWFAEASGGDSELYLAGDFEAFLVRLAHQRITVMVQRGLTRFI